VVRCFLFQKNWRSSFFSLYSSFDCGIWQVSTVFFASTAYWSISSPFLRACLTGWKSHGRDLHDLTGPSFQRRLLRGHAEVWLELWRGGSELGPELSFASERVAVVFFTSGRIGKARAMEKLGI
jgi:hypothetical protein